MPAISVFYKPDFQASVEEGALGLRRFVAGLLSGTERQLDPEEVSLRLSKMESGSLPVAAVEIEITAHAYPTRVARQDKICMAVVDYMIGQDKRLSGEVHVWLKLCELGHSYESRKPSGPR